MHCLQINSIQNFFQHFITHLRLRWVHFFFIFYIFLTPITSSERYFCCLWLNIWFSVKCEGWYYRLCISIRRNVHQWWCMYLRDRIAIEHILILCIRYYTLIIIMFIREISSYITTRYFLINFKVSYYYLTKKIESDFSV